MAEYIYRAVTKNGQMVKNRVQAISKQNLVEMLKNNELTPIDVVQVKYSKLAMNRAKRNVSNLDSVNKKSATLKEILATGQKVTNRDLSVFTQNLYVLKKADFNNVHALSTILESTQNVTLKAIIEDILAGVEAGEYMYTTMEYYSDIFPYIYVNMIKVGEMSGTLVNALEQANKYLNDVDSISKKVKSILLPNILQFVILMLLLIIGTLIAVPTIQGVYDSVGSTDQLPAITLSFFNFINGMLQTWYIPVFVILALVLLFIGYKNTQKGKYNIDKLKYKMPIFGKLIYSLDFSRFIKAMKLNVDSGMRIQEALEVSKNVVKNEMFVSMIESSINNIIEGASWIEPFEKSKLSSPMVTEMLKIGMETDLTEMMDKLAKYIEIDIDNILGKITKVLPQVAYSLVGIVLIFFVLIVLVPCLQVYMGGFMFSTTDLL